MKSPSLNSNPCRLPAVSTYKPTMSPCELIPCAFVNTAPGQSIEVKVNPGDWAVPRAPRSSSAQLTKTVKIVECFLIAILLGRGCPLGVFGGATGNRANYPSTLARPPKRVNERWLGFP